MGRPLQKPTITSRTLKCGRVSFLVTTSVGGKQLKKVLPTMDAAKALSAKWSGARAASYEFLPTCLTVQELRAAEGWVIQCREQGISPEKAALWLAQNYKKPADGLWEEVIKEFHASRRQKHRLKEGQPDKAHLINLVAAAKSFAAHVKRPNIGNPTQDEVESWLQSRGGYNQLLGDFRSFCIWAVRRTKMPSDPTVAIDRQIRIRGKVPTTLRPELAAEMLHTLEQEAPAWVPYAAVCLFAYIRPNLRESEAQRMDADIRAGQQVVYKDGLFIRISKNGDSRVIPWGMTGPLREWLLAYPIDKGLYPFPSPAKAEREWKKWRKRFALPKDVLRHTGISAAYYSGAKEADLDYAADNSAAIRKRDYIGRWSGEDTEQLWAIKPKYSASNRPPVAAGNLVA